LAFPKSKGFQGKYTPNMSLVKNIIVSAWGSPACDLTSLWGKQDQLESAHHGAKIFSSMGTFCSIFRFYYTSDYLATWGKCIVS